MLPLLPLLVVAALSLGEYACVVVISFSESGGGAN